MQPTRYPIGSWAPLPGDSSGMDLAERVAEWADLRFTLTFTSDITDDPATHARAHELLDLCAAHDIQAIVCDHRTAVPHADFADPGRALRIPDDYRARAAEAVAEFANHPATWAFLLVDEPLEGNFPAVAEASRILRDLTDQAEPFVNYMPNHEMGHDGTSSSIQHQVGFEDFGEYLDHVVTESRASMLCYDAYSSMSPEWGGPDNWYRNLADYQAAAIRNDICFWTIILTSGHWMYRAPSPLEMGWQFYNALA